MFATSVEKLKTQEREQGIEQGIERGIEQKAEKTAKMMLLKSYPLEDISEITGLTIREIKNL